MKARLYQLLKGRRTSGSTNRSFSSSSRRGSADRFAKPWTSGSTDIVAVYRSSSSSSLPSQNLAEDSRSVSVVTDLSPRDMVVDWRLKKVYDGWLGFFYQEQSGSDTM
ncbi:hypothetical protein QYF36_018756 [Acer negundo]|nr:hypothetical protein QYF36_018756 [Acer negundo]